MRPESDGGVLLELKRWPLPHLERSLPPASVGSAWPRVFGGAECFFSLCINRNGEEAEEAPGFGG